MNINEDKNQRVDNDKSKLPILIYNNKEFLVRLFLVYMWFSKDYTKRRRYEWRKNPR